MSTDSTTQGARLIDLDERWRLHPQVSVRPEPFGALLYHFGTRKLSFLKERRLLDVVTALTDHPRIADACAVAGIPTGDLRTIQAALTTLARSDMLIKEESP